MLCMFYVVCCMLKLVKKVNANDEFDGKHTTVGLIKIIFIVQCCLRIISLRGLQKAQNILYPNYKWNMFVVFAVFVVVVYCDWHKPM